MISYFVILAIVVAVLSVVAYALRHEQKIVEKAEKVNSMFNFYHIVALMTSPKYKNYKESTEEIDALEKYLAEDSVETRHPIGGYFKLCDSLKSTLKTCGNFYNYNLRFKPNELAIGFATFAIFAVIFVLGVKYC